MISIIGQRRTCGAHKINDPKNNFPARGGNCICFRCPTHSSLSAVAQAAGEMSGDGSLPIHNLETHRGREPTREVENPEDSWQ